MRTAFTVFAASLTTAAPAIADPGHDLVAGSLHSLAHAFGGLDVILGLTALAVAGGLVAVYAGHRSAKARTRR